MRKAWTSTIIRLAMIGSAKSFLLYTPTNIAPKMLVSIHPNMCSITEEPSTTQPSTTAAVLQHVDERPGRRAENILNPRFPGEELLSLGLDKLSEVLGGSGRAKMVWTALADGVDPFSPEAAIEFLTPKTAQLLKDSFESLPWKIVRESVSSCGTRKLLVRLEDGLEVETVVIPCFTGTRSTVCVSSQIGCAKNCQFCMTGMMGLVRNLTAGEILGQFFFARQAVREHAMPPLTNAVYMGMGEPLDNPVAVTQSLEVLTHPHSFAMAKSKISVSTVGPSPGAIRRMKEMPSRLAWSVHGATDDVRRLLVPTTVHTMVQLRDAFAEVMQSRRSEHLFVEVVLIQGVNDSRELAKALAELLRPLPTRASINLLPYNDTGHALFRAASQEAVEAFQTVLMQEGYVATIRSARGEEESAACGQLATSAKKQRASQDGRRNRGSAATP